MIKGLNVRFVQALTLFMVKVIKIYVQEFQLWLILLIKIWGISLYQQYKREDQLTLSIDVKNITVTEIVLNVTPIIF